MFLTNAQRYLVAFTKWEVAQWLNVMQMSRQRGSTFCFFLRPATSRQRLLSGFSKMPGPFHLVVSKATGSQA